MLPLWKKIAEKNLLLIKIIKKVRDHCHFTNKYRDEAHTICNLRFNVPNEIFVVFHNGSNYDYHFIIKELANELVEQFQCLGENTENYKTFSVPLEKEVTDIDKFCHYIL